MDRRRFISPRDAEWPELAQRLTILFNSIITPQFQQLSNMPRLSYIGLQYNTNDKNLLISYCLPLDDEVSYEDIDTEDIIDNYADIRDSAMTNIRNEIVPFISNEHLINAGIFPNRFVISVESINPAFKVSASCRDEQILLDAIIYFTVELNIEDLKYKPKSVGQEYKI